MASGISTAIIAGNLTRDAELNKSGRVLGFSVAVNRRQKDGEEWVDVAHFFDCKVLGNRAEGLSKILTKGMKVTVLGDLVQDRWETDDGQKRSAVRIIAREVVFSGSGVGGDAGSSGDAEQSSENATGW